MSLITRLVRSISLVTLSLLAVTPSALAQSSSWAIAQRDDAGVRKIVDMTLKHSEGVPGADSAAAIILYKERAFLGEENLHKTCDNLIFLVKDPSKVEWLTSPRYEEIDAESERAGFLIRGDELSRFDEGKAKLASGEGKLGLDRVSFEFGELQAGDVVGWSIVTEEEGPIFAELIPAVDRFPVVYSSVKVFNDGKSNFLLSGVGIAEKDLKVKTSGLVNDRPEKWSVNLRGLAAMEDLPPTGPYSLDTPVLTVMMIERHLEIENFYTGWVTTHGKVMTAGMLSGGREEWLSETGGVDIHASALTTGLAGAEEKEAAIFEFVRDQIAPIEGDDQNRSADRTVKEILKSKQASPYEKSILMIAMLDAVDVSAEMALVRPESWGPLAAVKELTFASFYQSVVRCGLDLGRYYAPQCGECEPGSLPAEWGAADLFSAKPGVAEQIQAYNEKIRTRAFAESGRLDMRQIQLDAEAHGAKEGWFLIESAGGE